MTIITKAVANRIAATIAKGNDAINARVAKLDEASVAIYEEMAASIEAFGKQLAKLHAETGALLLGLTDEEDAPAKPAGKKPAAKKAAKVEEPEEDEAEEVELDKATLKAITKAAKSDDEVLEIQVVAEEADAVQSALFEALVKAKVFDDADEAEEGVEWKTKKVRGEAGQVAIKATW